MLVTFKVAKKSEYELTTTKMYELIIITQTHTSYGEKMTIIYYLEDADF